MSGAEGRFWAFSVAVYRRPGVSDLCLRLQDRHGIDVNLLLWCAWAGAEAICLQRVEIEGAITATAPWRDSVVRPLRAVRRALKGDLGTIPAPETGDLRARVKAAELDAEHRQQIALETLLPVRPRADRATAAADNLRLYLDIFGVVPGPELLDLVAASLAPIGAEGLGGGAERA